MVTLAFSEDTVTAVSGAVSGATVLGAAQVGIVHVTPVKLLRVKPALVQRLHGLPVRSSARSFSFIAPALALGPSLTPRPLARVPGGRVGSSLVFFLPGLSGGAPGGRERFVPGLGPGTPLRLLAEPGALASEASSTGEAEPVGVAAAVASSLAGLNGNSSAGDNLNLMTRDFPPAAVAVALGLGPGFLRWRVVDADAGGGGGGAAIEDVTESAGDGERELEELLGAAMVGVMRFQTTL